MLHKNYFTKRFRTPLSPLRKRRTFQGGLSESPSFNPDKIGAGRDLGSSSKAIYNYPRDISY